MIKDRQSDIQRNIKDCQNILKYKKKIIKFKWTYKATEGYGVIFEWKTRMKISFMQSLCLSWYEKFLRSNDNHSMNLPFFVGRLRILENG